MIDTTIQLDEPIEHRGIVIAPLFPRRTPAAEYVTLEDALPLGLRIGRFERGVDPRLVGMQLGDGLVDLGERLASGLHRAHHFVIMPPSKGIR